MQIYVVMSQGNYMIGTKGVPVAAYPDYPSALAYAKSIFKRILGSQENPRDLVFLLTMSATTGAAPSSSSTTPTTPNTTTQVSSTPK